MVFANGGADGCGTFRINHLRTLRLIKLFYFSENYWLQPALMPQHIAYTLTIDYIPYSLNND